MNVIDAETRTGIDALVTEFSYLIDHGGAERIPALFTENGAFESPLATLKGRDAIAAAMAQRANAAHNTRHVITNLRLQRESADRILGTALLTMYRWTNSDTNSQPLPIALVEYEDIYQQTTGGWLFASRTAQQVLPTIK